MLFNSVIFLTLFLPLALMGWYLLQRLENPGYAKGFLLAFHADISVEKIALPLGISFFTFQQLNQ